MPTLFSYRVRHDLGSAPNPFWGLCTLAICKPIIRRSANVGDWIVGTGSAKWNFSDKVIYAMHVTQKMTMEEYDEFTRSKLPHKLPLMTSADPRRRSGDSIYDYAIPSQSPFPSLRPSVHGKRDMERDLSGKYVLLSDHFFYFGNKPIALPKELLEIVKKGPAHKGKANTPYFNDFVHWIYSLDYQLGHVGEPQSMPPVWSSQSHIVPLQSVSKRR